MDNIKVFLKKNIKIIIILLIVIALAFIGYTLALSKTTNVSVATGIYNVVYSGEATLPSSNLTPIYDSELTNDDNASKVMKVTFTVKGAETNPTDRDIIYDVSLTDLDLDDELHHELLKWRLYKNGTQISEGNFSYDFDSQINNRMVLTNIQQDLPSYSSNADSYVFYIWISESCTGDITSCTTDDDVTNLMNKTLSGKIGIELSTKSKKELVRATGIQPNSPDLVDGLIPVKYNETKKVWEKADSNNTNFSWYDYSNKKWANAVLVSDSGIDYPTSLKDVNISNGAGTGTYLSTNQGVNSSSSTSTFTIETGSNAGTLSFDYAVSSEKNYDKLTITLNGTTIVNAVSGTVDTTTYSVETAINTTYTIVVTYSKDSSNNSGTDTATISNFVYPTGATFNVTSTSTYPISDTTNVYGNSFTYDTSTNTYTLSETKKNYISSSMVGKYICSDITSSSCAIMYKVEEADTNITKVTEYSTATARTNVRNTYQNASEGTEIREEDILAFYVWIPRYKYKVWNINKVVGTQSYNAKTEGIDIVFENGTSSTGTISCEYSYAEASSEAGSPNEVCTGDNGDYYTHPAFTFGDTELKGFWIGKFEVSSSNPSASYGGGNTTSLTVRILPNVTSWRYNYLSNQSTVIQNMQIENNIYGLNTSRTNTDSHMLTNMEWGAVAYLTNSKYGRCTNGSCTEVTINNCSSYITGIGANTVSASSSSTTCTTDINKYNGTKGVLASTTGNITGVYDMSGGVWEYTMGNISKSSGSYTFYPSSSSFSSSWYTTSTAKYLTTYAYGTSTTNQTAYNRGRLGDATGEVVLMASSIGGWYNDYAYFPYSSTAWFKRGGYCGDSSTAGAFGVGYYGGGSYGFGSSRAALVGVRLAQTTT